MANTATKTGSDITEVVDTTKLTRWYLKVTDLNKKRVSSPQEAIEILNELRLIKGKIIEGSILEKSIKNLGVNNTNDINQAIGDLTEKKSNKTSVVDEGKIKELVAEYEQYIENGLSEKEALSRIKKENEENISAKEIESFIQRQSKIYQENIEIKKNFIIEKDNKDEVNEDENNEIVEDKKFDSEEVIEEFINKEKTKVKDELKEKKETKEDFFSEKEDVDEIIEKKSEEVSQKIIEEIGYNNEQIGELIKRNRTEVEKELKETVKKVIYGEEATLENGIIKIIQERDDSFVKQKISISNSSIKTIQLELNNWINKNEKQVIEYKGKVLEKKIETEIFNKNPELIKENKVDVENYSKFVKDFYSSTRIVNINQNREKAVNYAENVGLSPGQIGNGWNNLQAFTGLINSTQKPLELINQYKTLVEKIGNKIPTKIKECDSLNVVAKMAEKSDNFRHLIEKTQNILNWKENLISSVVSKFGLDKIITNVAGKVLGEEFVKNSLVILSQKSLEQGSLIILQSFIGGGIPSLTVAAATVTMETATAAAAAAAAALKAATSSFELASAAATAAVGTAAEASTAAALATATTAVATAAEAAATSAAAAAAAGTALTTATTAAGSSAALVGTAAVAGTGIGIPVAAFMLAVQAVFFLKKQFDKITEKLGISTKKFFEENFGKVGGFIIKTATFLIGLPLLLVGAISMISVIVSPIIIGVIGFFSIYQIAQGFFVSNLPPPKGTSNVEEIITVPNDPLDPIDPLLPNDPLLPEECPSGWPARSGYGSYITQGPLGTASHDGQQAIDIVIKDPNLYILATSPGTISYTNASSCGLGIIIASDCNGQNGRMVKTIYCHLSERYVTPGQVVTRGYILGKEGTTGSSSAPHLHYEVMYGGSINDYLPVNIPQFCYRCTSF